MHFPLLSSFGGTTILECRTVCSFGRLQEIALTFKSLSMRSAGAKDAEGALSYLAAIHRLARLDAQRGFILDWMSAQHMEETADEVSLLRAMPTMPADAIRKHLAELEALGDFPSAEPAIRIGERFNNLERIMMFSVEGITLPSEAKPKPVALDWDTTMKTANGTFDELAAALAQATPALCDAAIGKIEARMKKELEAAGMADDRALAKTLEGLAQMTPDQKAQASRCVAYWEILPWLHAGYTACPFLKGQTSARQRMTLLVLALAVHKADKGEYPESLDPLAPGILKKLPVDPFRDKPFIYKREGKGYTLYSVGPNGKDDGGKSAPVRPYRMPAPSSQPAEDLPDDIVVKFD
jgi:hypothetical protein